MYVTLTKGYYFRDAMDSPVTWEFGWVQSHHVDKIATLIVGDLFLPVELYRLHAVGKEAWHRGDFPCEGHGGVGAERWGGLEGELKVMCKLESLKYVVNIVIITTQLQAEALCRSQV